MSNLQRNSILLAAMAGTFAFAGAVSAGDVKVTLTGSEEVPAVTTSATGIGTIVIGDDKTVKGTVKTKDVAGIAAHVHLAPVGKNGPPVISLTKTADGEWSIPEGSKLSDEQYAAFKAGSLYVNVHSATNKSGEIRGQLKP